MSSGVFSLRFVFTTCLIIMGILILSGMIAQNDTGWTLISLKSESKKEKKVSTFFPREKSLWQERISRLKENCPTNRSHLGFLQQKQGITSFYQSPKSNFTTCKVPKSGSTYLAKVYHILETGYNTSQILQTRRDLIHGLKGKKGFQEMDKLSKTFNIIVARDPYSRLFSAYIDKLYLLGFPMVAKKASAHKAWPLYKIGNSMCGFNASFEDFLNYITTSSLMGQIINPHWSPVSLMCHACELDYHFVAMQHTLTKDVEHIVHNILPLTRKQKENINSFFHHKEALNKTVKGMLLTLLIQQKSNHDVCPSRELFLKKLWKSLKIQGYIDKRVRFPIEKLSQNSKNADVVKEVLEAMNKYKLSAEDKRNQRKEFLVNAYANIKNETLKKIQKVYKMDFELFGYPKSPPI